MPPQRELALVAAGGIVLALVVGVREDASALGLLAAVVLWPVATWAVHGVGRGLAGDRFALACAAMLLALPVVATAYFLPPYRAIYRHEVLPALIGVEHTAWFALGVALAVVARFAPARALAVAGAVAAAAALIVWGIDPLRALRNPLHETGWSIALLEAVPIAGFLGVARRSIWLAVGLGGWLAFFVLRAAEAPYDTGAFWRELAPAMPAAAILATSLALLVPRLRPAPARAPVDAP